jgi:hypothetical protein
MHLQLRKFGSVSPLALRKGLLVLVGSLLQGKKEMRNPVIGREQQCQGMNDLGLVFGLKLVLPLMNAMNKITRLAWPRLCDFFYSGIHGLVGFL